MKQKRASTRYAKALIRLSVESGCLQETYYDMILINNVCCENKELRLLLNSPVIKPKKKLEILMKIFKSKTGPLASTFISIITSKKRESLIPEISESFINLYKKHNDIQEATVVTSTKMSQDTKKRVIKYIEKNGGIKVELKEIIDEKIIGGIIIKMGDKQLDLSLSSEISELKQVFNKDMYIQNK